LSGVRELPGRQISGAKARNLLSRVTRRWSAALPRQRRLSFSRTL